MGSNDEASPSPPRTEVRRIVHKKRPKACKRCSRRKQGCHGFPICFNCAEAGVPCEQSEFSLQINRHSVAHAEALKRIQTLESQLRQATQQAKIATVQRRQLQGPVVNEIDVPLSPEPVAKPRPGRKRRRLDNENDHLSQASATRRMNASAVTRSGLNESVGTVMMHEQDIVSEDSTATSPATFPGVDDIVQATVLSKALASLSQGSQPSTEKFHKLQRSAAGVDDDLSLRFLLKYFNHLHLRYPFLDQSEVLELHSRRSQMFNASPEDRYATFKLHMLYAIGATMLKMTQSYDGPKPEAFYAKALQHMGAARQPNTISNIEAMVLLALYSLRGPWNSGIFYMVGLALRTCVDLGMHQESYYTSLAPYQSALRRRLFWSVYLLERVISIPLCRPLSLAEYDISTELPDEVFTAQPDGSDPASFAHFAYFIRIKRIASRIHSEVYRVDETYEQRLAKVGPLLESLDAWKASLPTMDQPQSDYMLMQWSNSVLLLLRPFLSNLHPADPLIGKCLTASGHVCNVFKKMHQRDGYGHSFVSAHSIFIAGVTLCYCIFIAPSLFTLAVSNSLRACSSTMFVMAERTPSMEKHRDVLETVMGRATDLISRTTFHSPPDATGQSMYHQLSQHDLLAVQSLIGLSAQQDPSILRLSEMRAEGAGVGQGPMTHAPTVESTGLGVPSSPVALRAATADETEHLWSQRFGIESQGLETSDPCSWRMVDEMMLM